MLHGNRIRVNKASADKQKNVEIGAELFIGNLDGMVDEKTLYDTFGQFGPLINAPKVARDENNMSKGYGFISYGDFESSDTAIANMHGQYMMNKQISVQYAYKKDGKGERHGDEAERMLAKQAKAHGVAPAVQPLPAHLFQLPASAPVPSGSGMQLTGPGAPGAPNGHGGGYGRPGAGPPMGMPSLSTFMVRRLGLHHHHHMDHLLVLVRQAMGRPGRSGFAGRKDYEDYVASAP
jgi:splicing factor 3B subunit 4